MNHFFENKNHLIDRLESLTDTQKEEIKTFFAKHPSYESKINWNDKFLSYEDFEPMLRLDGKSKTQAKKRGMTGLTDGVDYRYIGKGHNDTIGDYCIYQPLTYLGSVTLASNKVPPVKGNGARWCIAYQKDETYWNDYTRKGIEFAFILTADTKYAVTLYPKTHASKIEVYDFEDSNIGCPKWLLEGDHPILEVIDPERYLKEKTDAEKAQERCKEQLDAYVSAGSIVKNADGTYSKNTNDYVYLGFLIHRGELLCEFSYWKGDLDVSDGELISLKGFPKRVDGNFDCSDNYLETLVGGPTAVYGSMYTTGNRLTSLKGAPEKVGRNFNCDANRLKTLEGAPRSIDGVFSCSSNRSLTSLVGGPVSVGMDYKCYGCNLTSLEGAPRMIYGVFDCNTNHLTSLEGAPRYVEEKFDCSHNRLTSLEGGPKSVDGYYDCSYNPLETLKGAPVQMEGTLDCLYTQLTSLEGAPKVIDYLVVSSDKLTSLEGAPEKMKSFRCPTSKLTSLKGLEGVVPKNRINCESSEMTSEELLATLED